MKESRDRCAEKIAVEPGSRTSQIRDLQSSEAET